MTWLLPGSDKRTVLASPVIDVGIGVDLSTLVKRKISTVLAGGASDPQSALLLRKSAAAPMSATDKSPWRWKLILGALVDGIATSASAVSRAAPILGSAHGLPAVRISCLQTGQGRTVGYRELLLPLPPEAARRLRLAQRGESIDPTAMVKAQIAAIEDLQRRLRRALWHLHGQPDRTSPLSDLIAAASNRFTDAAGWALVHGLPGLLSGSAPPDFGAIARHYLARALLTVADPLRRARAELSYQKGPPPMTEAPDLLSRVARTISHWRQSLTPKDCAELRSGAETMALWACLSSIRDDELAATEGVWRIAILHVATKPKGGPAAGRALALSDYPEPRLLSLLAARDPGQVEQAIAWLKAREQAADVSQLVAYALAEVLGDDAARNWLRRRIAIDFVRSGSEASLDRRGADTEEAAATV